MRIGLANWLCGRGEFFQNLQPFTTQDGTIFSHFTDAAGAEGITNYPVGTLNISQATMVCKLSFGLGANIYLAAQDGDIFATDLGPDATVGQLNGIGVFGHKQDFVIRFSQRCAFLQSVRPDLQKIHIYSVRGNTQLKGNFILQRLR